VLCSGCFSVFPSDRDLPHRAEGAWRVWLQVCTPLSFCVCVCVCVCIHKQPAGQPLSISGTSALQHPLTPPRKPNQVDLIYEDVKYQLTSQHQRHITKPTPRHTQNPPTQPPQTEPGGPDLRGREVPADITAPKTHHQTHTTTHAKPPNPTPPNRTRWT
jgi:hypothetical protein